VRWEGPPTDNRERSGKVKDTGGSFFGEKKGLKGEVGELQKDPGTSGVWGRGGRRSGRQVGQAKTKRAYEKRGASQPILGGGKKLKIEVGRGWDGRIVRQEQG
jgi:hypothetical protein